MAEKDILIREKAEYTGVFDFTASYEYAFQWLRDEQYNVVEEKYNEKVTPEGREITIEWKAYKEITDYFKSEISIRFELKRVVDVEVEIEGKKKKMNKGMYRTELKGVLIRDPKARWESTGMYQFLREIYNKYIIPGRVDQMEDKVKDDAIAFKEAMKSFLEFSGSRQS